MQHTIIQYHIVSSADCLRAMENIFNESLFYMRLQRDLYMYECQLWRRLILLLAFVLCINGSKIELNFNFYLYTFADQFQIFNSFILA